MDPQQSAAAAAARQLLESSVDANPATMDQMWDLLGRYRRVLAELLAALDPGPARPRTAHAHPHVLDETTCQNRSKIECAFVAGWLTPLRSAHAAEGRPRRTLRP
jgi:hypothetical protein